MQFMAILLEAETEAAQYGVPELLKETWFRVAEVVVIIALIVLAVFLGAKLRKATDALKAKKASEAASQTNTEADKTDDLK